MLSPPRWLIRGRLPGAAGDSGESRAPAEVIALRGFGLVYLAAFAVDALTTRPYPALSGRGLVVLVATLAFVASAVAAAPQHVDLAARRRIAALAGVAVAVAVLISVQSDGLWASGPYYIGMVAALRLDRVAAALTLLVSLAVIAVVALIAGSGGSTVTALLGAVPWFLLMRVLRTMHEQREALEASHAAQARAAALAERGRLAREMHDVLAHSLSALSLQLESTRLLARDRGTDPAICEAIDQAHHLAVGGLQDARRAIAAARGDELPGPERLGVLAEAFGAQSGLTVALRTRGEPRALAPDARLAVYRTAQEALTNVRRHAGAERVEMTLSYLPEQTVLVVEDHAASAPRAPVDDDRSGSGYGLTGMRERAELLGGDLRALPTAHGFRVELRLPA